MAMKAKTARKSKSAYKPKGVLAGVGGRGTFSIITNKEKTVQERVAALAQTPLAVCDNDDNLQAILGVLRDVNEPVQVRTAAMQSLQTASFSVVAFESCSGDYRATLRKVALDEDPELRQRALGALAQQKDGFAEKKLLEGLQNPSKALVPPEKALQLLSYDVHADAYKRRVLLSITRRIQRPSRRRYGYLRGRDCRPNIREDSVEKDGTA